MVSIPLLHKSTIFFISRVGIVFQVFLYHLCVDLETSAQCRVNMAPWPRTIGLFGVLMGHALGVGTRAPKYSCGGQWSI